MPDPKKPRTALVRMRAGLMLPLPGAVVVDSPTNICTSEDPIRVLLDNRFIRNRFRSGDMVLHNEDPAALGLPEVANRHADEAVPELFDTGGETPVETPEKRRFFDALRSDLRGGKDKE
jgi:hypothetical protein